MNVLSLFDGMSCGQIALKELGIEVSKYYASEIDKHAIAQTKLNFPNTIQLGSVTGVDVSGLDKIDLLIGGSPCQSFSFAGKRVGMATTESEEIYTLERYLELKEQGFQFEGESYLFWEYMRILTDIRKTNPGVKFLLENVEMGKRWERVLSEAIGVFGVHINSSLVSAQTRKRIYWTNIRTRQEGLFGELHSDIPQPNDKGLLLKDILEDEVDEKYYISQSVLNRLENAHKCFTPKINPDKAGCLTIGNNSSKMSFDTGTTFVSKKRELVEKFDNSRKVLQIENIVEEKGFKNPQRGRIYSTDGICPNLTTCQGGGLEPKIVVENKRIGGISVNERGLRFHRGDKRKTGISELGTIIHENTKTDTHTTNHVQKFIDAKSERIRRVTPKECARLQTIPDWYKWACSDSQAYKMLGNGWTVEVIMHILSFLPARFFRDSKLNS